MMCVDLCLEMDKSLLGALYFVLLLLEGSFYSTNSAFIRLSVTINGPTTRNSLLRSLRAPELSQNTFTCAVKTRLFSTIQHC